MRSVLMLEGLASASRLSKLQSLASMRGAETAMCFLDEPNLGDQFPAANDQNKVTSSDAVDQLTEPALAPDKFTRFTLCS